MTEAPSDPRSFHVPAAPPDPAPAAPDPGPARKRRRRWPWVLGAVIVIGGLFTLFVVWSAWSSWRGVERVELEDVLSPSPTATNYLIVGTDSREGVDPDNPNADAIFGEGIAGSRTDTIAVLRRDGGSISLLAIPRDLYVDIGGGSERINAAFAFGGATRLVETVQRELGIGIDHYLEVDFAGFLALVDAFGGVTVEFEYPAHDPKSGLIIPTAGPVRLDRDTALAYVRSRAYTEITPDGERRDPTADLGRVERQQRFLAAVFDELGATRNPFTLLDALEGVSENVRVDDGMGLRDVISLGLALRGADPETFTVPTVSHTTGSGAQVLLLDGAEATAVLAAFR